MAGTQLRYDNVHCTWLKLVRLAGITALSESCRARSHDLRHRFGATVPYGSLRSPRPTPTRQWSTRSGHPGEEVGRSQPVPTRSAAAEFSTTLSTYVHPLIRPAPFVTAGR